MKLPNDFTIHAPNEEQSREVQEILFALGYSWNNSFGASYWKHVLPNICVCGKKLFHQTKHEFIHFTYEEFKQKTNMSKEIYTKKDPAAIEILKKMVADRGMKWYDSGYWIIRNVNTPVVSQRFDSGGLDWLRLSRDEYKEVPLHEFIYELGKIPVKQKEITIDILPWKVVIKGDKVDIGCRKDKNLETFKNTIFNVFPSIVGTKDFYGASVHFGKNGFLVDGQMISWETWDKFVEELKKVKDNP